MGKLVEALKNTRSKKWTKSTMYRRVGAKEAQLCLAGLVYESLGFTPMESLNQTQQQKLRNAVGALDGGTEFVDDGDKKLCDIGMRVVAETVDEKFPWVRAEIEASGAIVDFDLRKSKGNRNGTEGFIIKFNDSSKTNEAHVREVLEVALGKAKLADI